MTETVAERRADVASRWHRFHYPVAVFLIAFGAAKAAELISWARLHRNAARLLALGDGGVTALLATGKAAELLLTAVAVLALVRRRDVWLIAAIAGWLGEMAVLAVIAGVAGNLGRLAEHIGFVLLFVALLAVTYVAGVGVRTPRLREAAPPGGRFGTQEVALTVLSRWRRATAMPPPPPEAPPRQDTGQRHTTQPHDTSHETTQRDGAKEPVREDVPEHTREEAAPREADEPDATQQDAARQDAPRQDGTHPAAAGRPRERSDRPAPSAKVPEQRPAAAEPPPAEPTREQPRPARNTPSDQVTRQDMPVRRRTPTDKRRSE